MTEQLNRVITVRYLWRKPESTKSVHIQKSSRQAARLTRYPGYKNVLCIVNHDEGATFFQKYAFLSICHICDLFAFSLLYLSLAVSWTTRLLRPPCVQYYKREVLASGIRPITVQNELTAITAHILVHNQIITFSLRPNL